MSDPHLDQLDTFIIKANMINYQAHQETNSYLLHFNKLRSNIEKLVPLHDLRRSQLSSKDSELFPHAPGRIGGGRCQVTIQEAKAAILGATPKEEGLVS